MESHSTEQRYVRGDGQMIWGKTTLSTVRSPGQGPDRLFAVLEDVSEAHRLVQALSYQATHDKLTGLINRHEIERRLQQADRTLTASSGALVPKATTVRPITSGATPAAAASRAAPSTSSEAPPTSSPSPSTNSRMLCHSMARPSLPQQARSDTAAAAAMAAGSRGKWRIRLVRYTPTARVAHVAPKATRKSPV